MAVNGTQLASTVTTVSNDIVQTRTMVQGLFSADNPTQLAPGVTDYWIDYVHQQVQSLPNALASEKRELNTRVNQAKRLSKSQNVLQSDSMGGAGWKLGRKVFISPGDLQYKGPQLVLPPSSLVYPSYAYQTVPESALKPYTRYYLSVFVLQADSLHIISSRYGNAISHVVNVGYSTSMPTSPDGVLNSPHFFQYPIDVGAVHPDANLGITVGFTVPTNGFAKISQVSLTEARPLTAAEVRRVQNQDEQWFQPYLRQQAEIQTSLQVATNQLNAIYNSTNWSGAIGPNVTYTDLANVTVLEPTPSQPRLSTDLPIQDPDAQQKAAIFQATQRAWMQLQARNIVPNSLFLQGGQNWNVEGTVSFPQENNKPVLTLSDWDATVSQMISLPVHNGYTEYRVRVRAKGKGTISIVPPGDAKRMLFFNSPSFFAIQEFYFYPDTSMSQVNLIIQSEGSEFTVDWVEMQEMKFTEEPLGVNGGNAAHTVGITKPVGHLEASNPPMESQSTNSSSNCKCSQSSSQSNSGCRCSQS
ncbi:hypothetical protein [Bacillus thuringiensis]|uniref:hypothetical protein n=1 Tax=Bacillus thuringiensis TaxID=1428 RepID=UPI0009025E8F|nr:hypothetical protein [Bacillus thuringiensis]PGW46199.1 hypothetical protein COE03_15640 [Bacillus thuringiensis]